MDQHTRQYLDTLTEELHAIETLVTIQETVRRDLLARDWDAIDEKMRDVELRARAIDRMETLRSECYTALCRKFGVKERFSELCAVLDDVTREEMNRLYQRMKVAVLRFKCCAQQIDIYASELKAGSEALMEEYFPVLKDKRYGATGEYASSRHRALVCDWST